MPTSATRNLRLNRAKTEIHYIVPKKFGVQKMPVAGTWAELYDPGPVRRGYSLATGLIGRNREKGNVYVNLVNEAMVLIACVEIPRKFGRQAREIVALINVINRHPAGNQTDE